MGGTGDAGADGVDASSLRASDLDELPPDDQLTRQDREQDIKLKKMYAGRLLGALLAQLAVADGVFVLFAQFGEHWALEPSVVQAWLGATLVQTVGIVFVVARYLFPRRDIQP